jgi:predicted ATP-dependent serine protease
MVGRCQEILKGPMQKLGIAGKPVTSTQQPQNPIDINDLRRKHGEAYLPHAAELLARKASVKFLVPGCVPEGNIILVTGEPGGGKTWLTYELGRAVASGTKWLGQGEEAIQGPVVILNYDQPTDTMGTRLRELGFTADMPLFVHSLGVTKPWRPGLPEILLLPKEEGRLTDALRHIKPKLIIVDSLRQCNDLDENSNKDMAKLMAIFKKWCTINNTTIVIIHHTPKTKEGGWVNNARGAGEIVASSDVHISLSENKAKWTKTRPWRIGKVREVSFDLVDTFRDVEEEGSDEIDIVKSVAVKGTSPLPGQAEAEAIRVLVTALKELGRPCGYNEAKIASGLSETVAKEALRNARVEGKLKYVRTEGGGKGYLAI